MITSLPQGVMTTPQEKTISLRDRSRKDNAPLTPPLSGRDRNSALHAASKRAPGVFQVCDNLFFRPDPIPGAPGWCVFVRGVGGGFGGWAKEIGCESERGRGGLREREKGGMRERERGGLREREKEEKVRAHARARVRESCGGHDRLTTSDL